MRRRDVWGEGVMVGGLGRRCFLVGGCGVARVFGRGTTQCSARHVVCCECVCGKGLRTCLAWAKTCRVAGMSVGVCGEV
jgi:hypothetical protein